MDEGEEVAAGLPDGVELLTGEAAAGRILQVGREHREEHAVGVRDARVGGAEEGGERVAVEEALVVAGRRDRRLRHRSGRQRADDGIVVG